MNNCFLIDFSFEHVGRLAQFRAHFPNELSNSQAEIENGVAYKKVCNGLLKGLCLRDRFDTPKTIRFHRETSFDFAKGRTNHDILRLGLVQTDIFLSDISHIITN